VVDHVDEFVQAEGCAIGRAIEPVLERAKLAAEESVEALIALLKDDAEGAHGCGDD